MPLPPFHLGPGLLLGILTIRFFNLWAILLGSIIMDIEPAILLLINPCYNCSHHSFLHSVLGAILGSLILAIILFLFQKPLNEISLKFKIEQPFSFKVLFSSSFIAWLVHIFFDSLAHPDVFPFWPSSFNPIFIGREIYWPLNFIFIIFGILGLILFINKIKKYA